MDQASFVNLAEKYAGDFHPVIVFDHHPASLLLFDFTESNQDLAGDLISDIDRMANYIKKRLTDNNCRFGIGGYNEHRTIYARSRHFDKDPLAVNASANEEPRRLHLGIDIWGEAGTSVTAPYDAIVHSYANNRTDGDYGATIILTHHLENMHFHSLYGHLSLNSIKNMQTGQHIGKGEVFAEFGMRFENGNWPPHLHFQLILDMKNWSGDYPGVCKYSEREEWLQNSPDPEIILQMMPFAFYGR